MALGSELELPKVGDIIKVCLPGESPWAICLAVYKSDHTWDGELNNRLFTDRHSYKFGDVVRFSKQTETLKDEDVVVSYWVPAKTG